MRKQKIFIALPTKRYIEPEAVESLRDFVEEYCNDTFVVTHKAVRRGSSNIYYQRHNLAMDFLKTDCDYYLYWDSDNAIVSPPNAMEILINDDKDIICPLIVRVTWPHLPCVTSFEKKKALDRKDKFFLEDFRLYPYHQNRPFQVWRCSGGIA